MRNLIKKLRIKIVAIAMSAMFVLLFAILATINITNYSNIAISSDEMTMMIVNNNGHLNPPEDDRDMRPEAPFDQRFFIATIDKDGNLISVDASNITAFDEEKATTKALSIYEKKQETGWDDRYYRYRIAKRGNETIIVYADFTREIKPTLNVLYSSLIIGIVGLIVIFIIVYYASKLIVKPIDESLKKQKRFISNASHELKTPLAVISANNELIEMQYGENESSDIISRQVRKLNDLVINLNSLAKIDELEKLKVYEKINLSNLVKEIAVSYVELMKKKNKEFNINIVDGIECNGDSSMLKNLVDIILDNAKKYSKSKVELNLNKDGSRIVFEVINDVEDANVVDIEHIFERFYRSDDARALGIDGSGIGLSVAKEIVDLHHGRIMSKVNNELFSIKVEL